MFLPAEILFEIFKHYEREKDTETLRNLRLVNKRFYKNATPWFWKTAEVTLVDGVEHAISQMKTIMATDLRLYITSLCIPDESFWPISRKDAANPIWKGRSADQCEDSDNPEINFGHENQKFKNQIGLYLQNIVELVGGCKNLRNFTVNITQVDRAGEFGRQKYWSSMFGHSIFPAVARSNVTDIRIKSASIGAFITVLPRIKNYCSHGPDCSPLGPFPHLQTLDVKIFEPMMLNGMTIYLLKRDTRLYFFECGYIRPPVRLEENHSGFNIDSSAIPTEGFFHFTYRRN